MTNRLLTLFRLCLVLGVLLLLTSAAIAAPPTQIFIQGRLTDSDGQPYPPGLKNFIFNIYDSESDGSLISIPLHTPTLPVDEDGLWSYNLGSLFPLMGYYFNAVERWLEIEVDPDGGGMQTLSRVQLSTLPYAFLTATVDGSSGGTVTSTIQAPELELGSSTEDGSLEIYMYGATDPVVKCEPDSPHGGQLQIIDEVGNEIISMEPDHTGTGGWFAVRSGTASNGFFVDGNSDGLGSPHVTIRGDASTTVINTAVSGNTSVVLPNDAIASGEIFAELGAASNRENTGMVLAGGGYETIISQSIIVPDAGYVMVTAHACIKGGHTNGTTTAGVIGISDNNTSVPGNQDVDFLISSSMPSGSYNIPTAYTALFEVTSSGTYVYYLLGNETGGSIIVTDIQFNLVYIGTAYGSVSPTFADKTMQADDDTKSAALTPAQVDEIRTQSEADNARRIESEMVRLRAEMESIKAELDIKDGRKEGN